MPDISGIINARWTRDIAVVDAGDRRQFLDAARLPCNEKRQLRDAGS
jgi:hypothetical protein